MAEFQYLLILRRPGTVRLLLPTLVGRIPDSIAATAIVVLVRSVTGFYTFAGFAAGAFGIGTAACSSNSATTVTRRRCSSQVVRADPAAPAAGALERRPAGYLVASSMEGRGGAP